MRLIVNGEPRDVSAGTTVRGLLEALGVRSDAVAVERNREVVRRRDYDAMRLLPDDRVEVVTFVGGG